MDGNIYVKNKEFNHENKKFYGANFIIEIPIID